jgi:hypothetical protein
MIYAQLNEQGRVISVFGSPQDPDAWPGIVEMEEDDPRYLEFLNPELTPEGILASQSLKLQELTRLASLQKTALINRIGVLQDSIDLEMATSEELAELPLRQAQLLEWKRYAIYLGRVTGQDGWPPDVEWPVQPSSGMDLAVSAVAPDSPELQ